MNEITLKQQYIYGIISEEDRRSNKSVNILEE